MLLWNRRITTYKNIQTSSLVYFIINANRMFIHGYVYLPFLITLLFYGIDPFHKYSGRILNAKSFQESPGMAGLLLLLRNWIQHLDRRQYGYQK